LTEPQSGAAAFDVIIAGGGPAGAATAIALAQRGLRAALIERHLAPPARVGETLPPAVRDPLEALGLWQRFLADGHDPAVGNRSSWGSDRIDEIHFIRNAYGEGWHIDRQKFEVMLLDAAREAGVAVYAGARIDGWQGPRHRVTLAGGALEAPFAVDATGRASFLARILGAERVAIDQLVAATLFLEARAPDPQQRFTFIEAVEEGWWYSAPLPGGRLVAAFMTDGDLDVVSSLRDRDGWMAAVRRAPVTAERVAAYEAGTVAPGIASANTSRLSSVAGPDWLAAGDAAVSFDPLSSQGILTALQSAVDAAAAIADGSDAGLSRYASLTAQRYRDYLVERARYYGAEHRWPDAPFWRRRRITSGTLRESTTS
jgi:flavin-dependent dehydrogenase